MKFKHVMILLIALMLMVFSMHSVWAAADLALNMNAKSAFAMLEKDPKIIVLDVRTQPEFQFQGYIKGAYNVPYWFFGEKFVCKDKDYEYAPDVVKKAPMNRYQFRQNPDFMRYVREIVKSDDSVFIYCGSGARSSQAADEIMKAGYKNVINMLDGIEGKNGWKESNLPLEYMMKIKDLDPKYIYPPDRL